MKIQDGFERISITCSHVGETLVVSRNVVHKSSGGHKGRPYNRGGFEAVDWFDIILAGKHKQWNGEDMAKVVSGKIGDTVVESGNYICQNCGHYQYFEANDNFEECQSCYEPDITWELE